jgi:hypothetical protein
MPKADFRNFWESSFPSTMGQFQMEGDRRLPVEPRRHESRLLVARRKMHALLLPASASLCRVSAAPRPSVTDAAPPVGTGAERGAGAVRSRAGDSVPPWVYHHWSGS